MKWINNAPLCLVQQCRLDYELSGEQEAQQLGVRCTPPPPYCTGRRQRERLRRTYIKMSNKMPGGVTNALPSFPVHNRYAKISLISTEEEDTVTQTHTPLGPWDALSHTPSEVSHRRVWAYGGQRGAVKVGAARLVPADISCRICREEAARGRSTKGYRTSHSASRARRRLENTLAHCVTVS